MSRIFFIADTHFGHTNIIKYEDRPFSDVNEMDFTLIYNWNSVVRDDDRVFVLGDFSFYNKEVTTGIVKQLRGRKFLILGNHDGSRFKSSNFWREVGFKEVSIFPIIYKNFYILSHEPVYLNDCMPYVNIHGHIHSKKIISENKVVSNYVNVGVENINYTPISFEEIECRFKEQRCQY